MQHEKVGLADTMFARYDMASIAEQSWKTRCRDREIHGSRVQDLPVASKN